MNLDSAIPQCILAKVIPFLGNVEAMFFNWSNLILKPVAHSDMFSGNEPGDEDEDVDIGGNDPPTTSYFPIDGINNAAQRSSRGSSSSSSSSDSGSSSSGLYLLIFFLQMRSSFILFSVMFHPYMFFNSFFLLLSFTLHIYLYCIYIVFLVLPCLLKEI